MWAGCGYGALFLGLTAVLSVTEEPYPRNPGTIVVGFTLSGAAIGS